MISQRFIEEVVKNRFLSDRQKLQIYIDKTSKSQEPNKEFPCPNCGEYSSHIVKRATYWKRICASCGFSFAKQHNKQYSKKYRSRSKILSISKLHKT